MKVPLVNLKSQFSKIRPQIESRFAKIFSDTAFIQGPHVREFEESFSQYSGVSRAVGTASGTDALMIAYQAAGFERGDEVIVPANTFIATASPLWHLGVTPVFVDVDPDTYLLDLDAVKMAVSPRTKGLVPVHLYGQPVPMDQLFEVCDKHGITLIEDCAQAHGAAWQGRPVGSWGAMACYSFYPGKNLGAAGDAGAVVTQDERLEEKLRLLVNHGSESKYVHSALGLNSRMDALQAAVLTVKLQHMAEWTEKRRSHAEYYNKILGDIPGLKLPLVAPSAHHVYHLYVVQVPGDRDRVLQGLHERGVGAGIHYPIPLPLQPVFRELGHKVGDFPVTEQAASRIVSLPLCPEITEEQMDYVASCLREACLSLA
jgi:dTDP-4-amino-4,6-dideoxygalactose transaminase